MKLRPSRACRALLSVACVLPIVIGGCGGGGSEGSSHAPAADGASGSVSPGEATLPTAAAAAWESELLDLAFAAASKFPLDPHIKNRSRVQLEVVESALALGDVQRAERYAAGIANWRAGLAAAHIAYHLAEAQDVSGTERWMKIALARADQVLQDPDEQKWRGDRIRVRVASAEAVLGRWADAVALAAGSEPSEEGAVLVAQAEHGDTDFDEQLQMLTAVLAKDDFDASRFALGALARLYRRHHAEASRREAIEARVRSGIAKLPDDVKVTVLSELSRGALAAGARSDALRLAVDAVEVARQLRLRPQDNCAVHGRLGGLLAACGDEVGARSLLTQAGEIFDQAMIKKVLVDMFAARALRPVAVGWQELGDAGRARAVFARVLDVGALNPNSRPRCDDLVATIAAMLACGFSPDDALSARLREIADGLGDPW